MEKEKARQIDGLSLRSEVLETHFLSAIGQQLLYLYHLSKRYNRWSGQPAAVWPESGRSESEGDATSGKQCRKPEQKNARRDQTGSKRPSG